MYSLPSEPSGKPNNTGVVAYPFSRAFPWPRNWTGVSCIAGRLFTNWALGYHQLLSVSVSFLLYFIKSAHWSPSISTCLLCVRLHTIADRLTALLILMASWLGSISPDVSSQSSRPIVIWLCPPPQSRFSFTHQTLAALTCFHLLSLDHALFNLRA